MSQKTEDFRNADYRKLVNIYEMMMPKRADFQDGLTRFLLVSTVLVLFIGAWRINKKGQKVKGGCLSSVRSPAVESVMCQ